MTRPRGLTLVGYGWVFTAAMTAKGPWFLGALLVDLLRARGPGTGGAVLMIPLVLLAIPVSTALSAALLWIVRGFVAGQPSARGLLRGLSIGSLALAVLSLPVTFYLGLAVFYGAASGYPFEGVAITGFPWLCLATLLVLRRPSATAYFTAHDGTAARSAPVLAYAGVVAAIVLLSFVPARLLAWLGPKPLSMTETAAIAARYSPSILADDTAALDHPEIWNGAFVCHDLDGTGGIHTCDPLEYAIERDRPRSVAALVKQRRPADLEHALAFALESRRLDVVQPFFDRGVKATSDEVGMAAIRSCDVGVVELLVAHGADTAALLLDAAQTPWMKRDAQLAIAARLLALGADPTRKDRQGKTALDWARSTENVDLEQLLAKAR